MTDICNEKTDTKVSAYSRTCFYPCKQRKRMPPIYTDHYTLKNQAVVGMDEVSITTITHNSGEDEETTTNWVSAKIVVNDKDHDVDRQIVSVGDVVTYKIPYQNRSSNPRSIMITDILPQGVLYMSASDGWECAKHCTWTDCHLGLRSRTEIRRICMCKSKSH